MTMRALTPSPSPASGRGDFTPLSRRERGNVVMHVACGRVHE